LSERGRERGRNGDAPALAAAVAGKTKTWGVVAGARNDETKKP
jgi:hypothetical protein